MTSWLRCHHVTKLNQVPKTVIFQKSIICVTTFPPFSYLFLSFHIFLTPFFLSSTFQPFFLLFSPLCLNILHTKSQSQHRGRQGDDLGTAPSRGEGLLGWRGRREWVKGVEDDAEMKGRKFKTKKERRIPRD